LGRPISALIPWLWCWRNSLIGVVLYNIVGDIFALFAIPCQKLKIIGSSRTRMSNVDVLIKAASFVFHHWSFAIEIVVCARRIAIPSLVILSVTKHNSEGARIGDFELVG
jgi:hypothetical protein